MRRVTFILALFVIILIAGCKVTGDYFLGNGWCNVHIKLKKDNTFTYITFADEVGTDSIKGKWKLYKGVLTLNSFAKPNFVPNSILEKNIPHTGTKLIFVYSMDNAFRVGSIISINNGKEMDTLKFLFDTNYVHFLDTNYFNLDEDFSGVYCHLDSIKSIRIVRNDYYCSNCILKDSVFKISNPTANLFLVFAEPYNHYMGMKYFVNTEWKLRFNRIYPWRKTKTKFDKKYFLTKKRSHIAHTGELP